MISVDGNSQENSLQNFSISNGLESLSINDIVQDEVGYLWLATGKGLVRFDGSNFKNFDVHSQSKATGLFTKNNYVLIAHTSGIFHLKNHQFSYLGNEQVNKIVSLNDKILLATNEGLYQLINEILEPLKIQSQIDFSIINDIISFENAFYIASNNGLWKLDKLINPKEVHKIIDSNIKSLQLINNQLAIQFKNKIQFYKNNKISSKIEVSEEITSINNFDGKLWITTNGDGIHIYNLPNYTFERKINKYNSTLSNNINTIFKDKENLIWIGSADKGLYKYSLNNLLNKKEKNNIYFENILVNYKKRGTTNSNNLVLKPNENNISFSYKTIALNNSKNIKYRYQLNDDFTRWSVKNSVDFANLKSGKYIFTVQSKNGDLLSKKESFNFTIETPIYKQTWFNILSISLLLLLIALLIEVKLSQIKKRNKKEIGKLKLENHLLNLEQKALQLQMNPHFIFNVLNGIKALGNSGKPKELNKIISQFSVLLRSVLNNSRLEEISLHDEIETLKNYLELEQKMNSKPFNFSIETVLNNIDSEEVLIPPMIIQPFIENCIKHAFQPNTKNAKIEVVFKIEGKFLLCKISDNGIGFLQSKKEKTTSNHQSVALKVTKERIQNLSKYNNFTMKEITENNTVKGTEVLFKIPLKTDF